MSPLLLVPSPPVTKSHQHRPPPSCGDIIYGWPLISFFCWRQSSECRYLRTLFSDNIVEQYRNITHLITNWLCLKLYEYSLFNMGAWNITLKHCSLRQELGYIGWEQHFSCLCYIILYIANTNHLIFFQQYLLRSRRFGTIQLTIYLILCNSWCYIKIFIWAIILSVIM